ncbi:hypothetical protein FQN57_006779 [Myotisia sp. PD_48]|nr:hypothetical protein FQN57_006779 [Myotisia sp. PD_48]
MAKLNDLLNEIVDEIVKHLKLDTIYSLARVCRRFYTFINITERQPYHRIRTRSEWQLRKAHSMLPALLRQPRLAHYVRELDARTPGHQFMIRVPIICWSTEERGVNTITTALEQAGFQDEKNMKSSREILPSTPSHATTYSVPLPIGRLKTNDAYHAFAAILISICSNIEILKLRELALGSPMCQFLKRANMVDPIIPCLRNLQAVYLHYSRTYRYEYKEYDFAEVVGLFHRLPSIKIISINSIYIPWKGSGCHRGWKPLPGTSNFTSIRITYSCTSSECLAEIIKQSKVLEEFTYTLGTRLVRPEYYRSIRASELRQALLLHQSTLRFLNLDVDFDLISPPGGTDDRTNHSREHSGSPSYCSQCTTSIGPLLSFTSLTHLSIGIQLLLGGPDDRIYEYVQKPIHLIDILPPNLQRLTTRGYQHGECQFYTDIISQFLQDKTIWFPSLKDVQGIEILIPSGRHIRGEDEEVEFLVNESELNSESDEPRPRFGWNSGELYTIPREEASFLPPSFNFYLDTD